MKNKFNYIADYIFCLLIVQPLQFIFIKIYAEEIFKFNKTKLKEMKKMKLIYFIIHTFIPCSEKHLELHNKGKRSICKKCGRTYFNFQQY